MLKVLIVDDEMLIRKRMIFGFDWEAMGYEIEDEAGDGEQALRLMEEKQYDLAVVDIAMPGMSGIELAKRIREKRYETQIIFLTGHSDFKYAQQAVQYGVCYYILKPVNEDEFIDMLGKLRLKIEEEKDRTDLLEQLEKKQGHMDAVLQAKIFSDYLHDTTRNDLEKQVSGSLYEAGIQEDDEYLAALFWIRQFTKERLEFTNQADIMREACLHIWKTEGLLTVCDLYEDYVTLILKSSVQAGNDTGILKMEQLADFLQEMTGGSVRGGVSLSHRGIRQIGTACAEAASALNNAKVLEEKVLSYRMVKERKSVYYKIDRQELKDLQMCITRNDYEGCQVIISRIFEEMADRKVNFEGVVMNVNRLFMELVDMGVISNLDIRRLLNGYHDVEKVLNNMADMREMAEWCATVIYTLMESEIRLSLESKSLPVVEKTCEYIRDNYGDAELTQTRIAEAMFVSSSYLSGTFKKVMGVSMMQYITMVRMERARELLLDSGQDVKDIAGIVGYHDEYYFSRCFKKQYGMSPMQLRKLSDTRRVRKEGMTS